MKMLSDNGLKAVCTVTELAKKLGLSRARFYQLQNLGVFPKPVYCIRTKRPFYPLDLQQQCIRIRKTGIGHNGQPIVFYSLQKDKSRCQTHLGYKQLTDTLRQMGLNVTLNTVTNTVKSLYPEELTQRPVDGSVIRDLFRHFKQGL